LPTWASSTSLKDMDMVRFSIMTLLFGVKIGFSGEKKALPVGFSGKARYLQASMHISYKKWLSGCCRD